MSVPQPSVWISVNAAGSKPSSCIKNLIFDY
jgi:hypothetical protein